MGGLLRSLSIAEQAQRLDIPIVIGAQVGETSTLTRAALTVATAFLDILIAQEGGFGAYLLERDITNHPIMFGSKGLLTVDELGEKSGLGVDIEVSIFS